MNLNFIFQGCQILYVRVAISKKANEIDFQDTNKMIDHLLIYNTTILLIVEDLVSLFGFWAEVCGSTYS